MTPIEFTDEELKAIRKEYAAGSSDEQFTIFISECKRRGLTPGRHIVFQTRRAKEYDSVTNSYQWVSKPVYITTISALLLIAQRTGDYEGQGRGKYLYVPEPDETTHEQFIESSVPLPDARNPRNPRTPWVAESLVYRKGFREPMIGQARFEAYASYQKDDNNGRKLTQMWSTRGCEQLLKCATAAALRSAFPEETNGLYLLDELRSEDDAPHTTAVTPASVVPLPPPVPAVNQIPAIGTEAPRPGETTAEYHVTSVPAALPAHSGSVLRVVQNDGAAAEFSQDPRVVRELEKAKKAMEEGRAAEYIGVPNDGATNVPNLPTEGVITNGKVGQPEPEKKKTRKPKEEPRPENGQNQGGITDEDLKNIGTPAPVVDEEAAKRETEEFIAGIDPTPTKEELSVFHSRARALRDAGAKSDDISNYLLSVSKKSDRSQLTIRDWRQALDQLEAAQAEGKLVEVSKAAPLPAF